MEKSALTDSVKASFFLSRRVLKAETHIVFTQHGTSDHGKGSPSFVRGHSPLTLLNTVRISAFARTFLPRVDSLNTLESETPPLVTPEENTCYAWTLACKIRIWRQPTTSTTKPALRITGPCVAQLSCALSSPPMLRPTLSRFTELSTSGKYVTLWPMNMLLSVS